MATTCGIDFGTTNSALSVNHNGRVEIIDIDKHNMLGKTLRSVLYFDEDNDIFVGQEAVEKYINNGAVGRFMQSIKSFLPSKQFDYTHINRKRYGIDDLIAIILRKIKREGEKVVDQTIESVVLGRPALFSEDADSDALAEKRLKAAAQKAGFKTIDFQYEPIAAALAFEKTLNGNEEKKVLVGDFGGGTSDFSIIKLHGDTTQVSLNRKNDVLAIGGVYIGGDTFDSQIMWSKIAKCFGKDVLFRNMTNQWLSMPSTVSEKLRHWHLIPQLRERGMREYIKRLKLTADNKTPIENLENLIDDDYGFMLFQAIEKSKVELSSHINSQIVFHERALLVREKITRSDLNDIIGESITKIEKCIDSVLTNAGLTTKDIDTVFVTGGSSYIPRIKEIFLKKFERDKMQQMNVFTGVAYGLGVSASMHF